MNRRSPVKRAQPAPSRAVSVAVKPSSGIPVPKGRTAGASARSSGQTSGPRPPIGTNSAAVPGRTPAAGSRLQQSAKPSSVAATRAPSVNHGGGRPAAGAIRPGARALSRPPGAQQSTAGVMTRPVTGTNQASPRTKSASASLKPGIGKNAKEMKTPPGGKLLGPTSSVAEAGKWRGEVSAGTQRNQQSVALGQHQQRGPATMTGAHQGSAERTPEPLTETARLSTAGLEDQDGVDILSPSTRDVTPMSTSMASDEGGSLEPAMSVGSFTGVTETASGADVRPVHTMSSSSFSTEDQTCLLAPEHNYRRPSPSTSSPPSALVKPPENNAANKIKKAKPSGNFNLPTIDSGYVGVGSGPSADTGDGGIFEDEVASEDTSFEESTENFKRADRGYGKGKLMLLVDEELQDNSRKQKKTEHAKGKVPIKSSKVGAAEDGARNSSTSCFGSHNDSAEPQQTAPHRREKPKDKVTKTQIANKYEAASSSGVLHSTSSGVESAASSSHHHLLPASDTAGCCTTHTDNTNRHHHHQQQHKKHRLRRHGTKSLSKQAYCCSSSSSTSNFADEDCSCLSSSAAMSASTSVNLRHLRCKRNQHLKASLLHELSTAFGKEYADPKDLARNFLWDSQDDLHAMIAKMDSPSAEARNITSTPSDGAASGAAGHKSSQQQPKPAPNQPYRCTCAVEPQSRACSSPLLTPLIALFTALVPAGLFDNFRSIQTLCPACRAESRRSFCFI